jgi:hypothetical protein
MMLKIIETANAYLGNEETPNNSGFKNPDFEAEMREAGWEPGEAWCASFTKLVFKKAYQDQPDIQAEIERLFSKSATKTHANFDASDWKTRNPDGSMIMKPAEGALVVWRMGKSWAGHIGIVTKRISDTEFETIEGNTNEEGGREGIEVAYKRRFVTREFKPKGLNPIGFILPK